MNTQVVLAELTSCALHAASRQASIPGVAPLHPSALAAVGVTLAAFLQAGLAPIAAVLLQVWVALGAALLPLFQVRCADREVVIARPANQLIRRGSSVSGLVSPRGMCSPASRRAFSTPPLALCCGWSSRAAQPGPFCGKLVPDSQRAAPRWWALPRQGGQLEAPRAMHLRNRQAGRGS